VPRVTNASVTNLCSSQGQAGWVLHGEKRWIGNGTHADVMIVWAKNSINNKVHGFIVERGAPGLTTAKIENKVAMREVQK
jgi:alkylation response protein AidB-like acyl-CoA dehydrogenase